MAGIEPRWRPSRSPRRTLEALGPSRVLGCGRELAQALLDLPALLGRHLLEALADPLALLRREAPPAFLVFEDALLLIGRKRLELPEAVHDLVALRRGKLLEALVGVL